MVAEGSVDETMRSILEKEYPEEKEDATTILKKADELTNCDRQEAYGHPATNFQNTANFWNTYINGKYPEVNLSLTNEDVGFMMLLLKVSRELNAPKFDNLLDGVGYLKTVQMIRDYGS